MREDEVYLKTKEWFKFQGFNALAGQPPNGCDNIPVVEIKDSLMTKKGSLGSYKPDLIFGSANYIIIAECKPLEDANDLEKLRVIACEHDRQIKLFDELKQRSILKRFRIQDNFIDFQSFKTRLRFCLCHAGSHLPDLIVNNLVFDRINKTGQLLHATDTRYIF